jgi:hypothetical protein
VEPAGDLEQHLLVVEPAGDLDQHLVVVEPAGDLDQHLVAIATALATCGMTAVSSPEMTAVSSREMTLVSSNLRTGASNRPLDGVELDETPSSSSEGNARARDDNDVSARSPRGTHRTAEVSTSAEPAEVLDAYQADSDQAAGDERINALIDQAREAMGENAPREPRDWIRRLIERYGLEWVRAAFRRAMQNHEKGNPVNQGYVMKTLRGFLEDGEPPPELIAPPPRPLSDEAKQVQSTRAANPRLPLRYHFVEVLGWSPELFDRTKAELKGVRRV